MPFGLVPTVIGVPTSAPVGSSIVWTSLFEDSATQASVVIAGGGGDAGGMRQPLFVFRGGSWVMCPMTLA